MVDHNTAEYLTLKKNNEIITSGIRQNLVTVAQALFREAVIPRPVLEEIEETIGIASRTKASKVVNTVSDKVLLNTHWFWVFVNILNVEEESKELASRLKTDCEGKGGREH